ncbi:hypothetical protein ACIBHY_52575 [Nonomuraea sp. NPDC050547]|uniref:hypothetical protein n=1 Tax=Nonomuraea sp. NPDC050547 TaxID=3364368 RepID=UPI0037B0F852
MPGLLVADLLGGLAAFGGQDAGLSLALDEFGVRAGVVLAFLGSALGLAGLALGGLRGQGDGAA